MAKYYKTVAKYRGRTTKAVVRSFAKNPVSNLRRSASLIGAHIEAIQIKRGEAYKLARQAISKGSRGARYGKKTGYYLLSSRK